MTQDEAIKVVKIMLTADGWCPVCQGDLMEQFKKAFPEMARLADDLEECSDDLRRAHEEMLNQWWDNGRHGPEPQVWDAPIAG